MEEPANKVPTEAMEAGVDNTMEAVEDSGIMEPAILNTHFISGKERAILEGSLVLLLRGFCDEFLFLVFFLKSQRNL